MTIKYAFVIIFIHLCFQDGMILAPVRRLMDKFITSEYIRKPLYECPVCMSGIYTLSFWILEGNAVSTDVLWAIGVTGGIVAVLSPFVEQTIFSIQKRMTDG